MQAHQGCVFGDEEEESSPLRWRSIYVFGRLLYKLFNRSPAIVRVGLFPSLLSVIGLAFLRMSTDTHWIIMSVTIILYGCVLILNAGITYANSEKNMESTQSYDAALVLIESMDQCVSEKRRRLLDAFINRGELTATQIARAAKARVGFSNSLETINQALFASLKEYLRLKRRLGNAHLFQALLVPDAAGYLRILGADQHSKGCMRTIESPTKVSISSEDTLAGILWNDIPKVIATAADTKIAESEGRFKFFDPSERDLVKSILCYKIVNPLSGKPYGVWAVDSDRVGVFPPEDDDDVIGDITTIFNCFAERIRLEIVYKEVIERIEPGFQM